MELILFVGLQASGKSTFYERHFAGTHALVSKDRMPRGARNKQRRMLEEVERYLTTGRSVVVDNTSPKASDRSPLIELGKRAGARVIVYFFEPHVGDSLRRNASRTVQVPAVAIFTTAKKMEKPRPEEGIDELHTVRLEEGAFSVSAF